MLTQKSFRVALFVIVITCALWWSSHGTAGEIASPDLNIYTLDPVLGRPFNISTGSIDERNPAVAYNSLDKEFLVVWENSRAVDNDIYAQRISEQGKFLSWFYVANGENPAVAYNPKNNTYLVAYQRYVINDNDIYATRVDFTGPMHTEIFVAWNINESEHNPAVAYNTHPHHDEFLIVWENPVPGSSSLTNIEAQRVAGTAGGGDGGGETIGGRILVADNNIHYPPDVAYNLNMNEYLVVYTCAGSGYDVYGRRITWDGYLPALKVPIDTSTSNQYAPKVAAYRLNQVTPYLVVFTDQWNDINGDVRGYLLNQEGAPMQLIHISTIPGLTEYQPSIAYNEAWGGYIITWTYDYNEILGRRVYSAGQIEPEFKISEPFPISCGSTELDIALGNTAGLAVWMDSCGSGGGWDILGRLLGYQQRLPMIIRR